MYCVYRHTTPDGRVYVGMTRQTPENRWKDGYGYRSSPYFWDAIVKFGWDNIAHEVLHENLTEEEASEYERYYIEKHNSSDPVHGYNGTSGGKTGTVYNKLSRAKISEANKRFFKEHPEKRKVLSERAKCRVWTDESRIKLSKAKTGVPLPRTKEWSERIAESNRKRYAAWTEEDHKERSRICKEAKAHRMVRVEQLDSQGNVIAVFDSMNDASRATGIRDGNISLVCAGKRNTAGGYGWRIAT